MTTTPAHGTEHLLPVTQPGDRTPNRTDRLLVVTDPDPEIGTVTARWDLNRSPMWRCGHCGPQTTAECAHTFSAAVRLAEDLLGLEPIIRIPADHLTRTRNEGTTP